VAVKCVKQVEIEHGASLLNVGSDEQCSWIFFSFLPGRIQVRSATANGGLV